MKKIVLTGGGTAGHITANIALIPELIKENYEIHYIGSYSGMEKEMIERLNINYIGISSGKLRRYLSLRNLTDPFRVIKGYSESIKILKRLKPDVVFSKGGFVTVPVVFAAKKCGIPVIIHESDFSPGLANRLCIPKADFVLANFKEALQGINSDKAVLSGTPIREELFSGNRESGFKLCGFKGDKPVILVIGGSLGAAYINEIVRQSIDTLLEKFDIVHICGRGKKQENIHKSGYIQFEYLNEEIKDIFSITDLAVSRAGANAIYEFLALKIPNILIPLSAKASRGDQILNANSFKSQGYSEVILEEDLSSENLIKMIECVYKNRKLYIENMNKSVERDAINTIINLIKTVA